MDVLGNFRSDIIVTAMLTGYFFFCICCNKNTLMMCKSLFSKVQISLELRPSAKGTERLISESWSGFLCVGSCGDGGGRVSRSTWKASLFQCSSLVWGRRLKTDLNTALWLGTQKKAVFANHAPNFDWHVRFCSNSLFKLFIFITFNENKGMS